MTHVSSTPDCSARVGGQQSCMLLPVACLCQTFGSCAGKDPQGEHESHWHAGERPCPHPASCASGPQLAPCSASTATCLHRSRCIITACHIVSKLACSDSSAGTCCRSAAGSCGATTCTPRTRTWWPSCCIRASSIRLATAWCAPLARACRSAAQGNCQ